MILARSLRNFDATSDATVEEEHTPTTTTPTRICAYSRCKCKIDLSEGFRKSHTKRMRLCEEYASFASYDVAFASYDVAFVGDNPTSFEIKHTFQEVISRYYKEPDEFPFDSLTNRWSKKNSGYEEHLSENILYCTLYCRHVDSCGCTCKLRIEYDSTNTCICVKWWTLGGAHLCCSDVFPDFDSHHIFAHQPLPSKTQNNNGKSTFFPEHMEYFIYEQVKNQPSIKPRT